MKKYLNVNQNEVKRYTTAELRENFLIQGLFHEDQITVHYVFEDRVIIGGIMPVHETLEMEAEDLTKTRYFLERREMGIVNISKEPGIVTVEGEEFILNEKDCLYVGKGNKHVAFKSCDSERPAKFYIASTPAHRECQTMKKTLEEAEPQHLGSAAESNERTINKYIHEDGIKSCQLMLGVTVFKPGSMWNTMPAHIHERRSEIYFYFDMDPSSKVFHFMGEPDETRHLIVGNEEGVRSPNWSIHSGAGTGSYTFIWVMAGENYTFSDMDQISMEDLR